MGEPRPATGLLVTLGSIPAPAGAAERAAGDPYAARLLDQWRTHMPDHPHDGTGDTEDFWEMAARLDAALHSGASRIWLADGRKATTHARDVADGPIGGEQGALPDLYTQVAEGTLLHYGPISNHSALWRAIDTRADGYATTATFARHAGRRVVAAGFALEEAPGGIEILDVMVAWASEGVPEVIVKANRAKHGIWRLPVSTDREVNRRTVFDRMDWAPIYAEGQPGAFLVQEVVPMRFEYRVFVVDRLAITGAGCVEEHTPLNGDPAQPFSPLVREDRRMRLLSDLDLDALDLDEQTSADPVVGRPALVERYRVAAERFAREAAEAGEMPRSYVVDLAIRADAPEAEPLVIECNGLSNAGLYASQPRLVTRALVRGRCMPA